MLISRILPEAPATGQGSVVKQLIKLADEAYLADQMALCEALINCVYAYYDQAVLAKHDDATSVQAGQPQADCVMLSP